MPFQAQHVHDELGDERIVVDEQDTRVSR